MWSALDKVDKIIKDVPLIGDIEEEQDMDFMDILILRVGFEYFISGGIILRGGFGYDRYATPEDTLNISNIDVDKFTLIGGIGYRTGRTQIDFVFLHANGRQREQDVAGYPDPARYNLSATIMGVGLTYSF